MKIVPPLPVAALVTLCCVCLAACGRVSSEPSLPTSAAAPKVSALLLQAAPLSLTAQLPGRVTPMTSAQVRPQVTGIIQEKLFQEGDRVKAGQALYQIDPAVYVAADNSAKAALAKAEASLVLAQLKARRNQELVQLKAVSRESADESEADYKQALANVASARAVAKARSIDLQHTIIQAPVGGRIGRSMATVGSLVTANQPSFLASIQQLNPIYIDVTQSSLALRELKQTFTTGTVAEGAAVVDIVLQNNRRYEQRGVLQFSEVTVDQATDTVTLRIKVANPNSDLLPGMYANVVLEMGAVEHALMVPKQAVTRDALGHSQVALVNANGIVEQRTIKVSRTLGEQLVVQEGLAVGDRVIVAGQQKARPGAKVELVSLDTRSAKTHVVQL